MTRLDFTAIILALLSMAGGWVPFFLDRRKYRQEVRNLEAQAKALEAETEQKYMSLSKQYVDEYNKNIVIPLESRVNDLTKEVDELRKELENVKKSVCYRPDCRARISML